MFWLLFVLPLVSGHGYMCEPPARNSAWNCGKPDAPINYDLMALNAGGVGEMYPNYPEKCPQLYRSCGDALSGQPEHSAGGKYDIGPLRSYKKGETIPISIVITAHHQGHFLLQLCPTYPEVESCFSLIHQFSIQDKFERAYNYTVQLPPIACERCILRWIYVTNNSPGLAPELFLNCADISIQ